MGRSDGKEVTVGVETRGNAMHGSALLGRNGVTALRARTL